MSINNIKFIESLYDLSWVLLDYVRDKRYEFKVGEPVQAKADVPEEVLQAIVNLNALMADTLRTFNKPSLEIDDADIPETIIDTVEVSKEGNSSSAMDT